MSGDQSSMNAQLINKFPYDTPGSAEKAASRQARKAEKAFRISKGYEKDSLFSRFKRYFQKN